MEDVGALPAAAAWRGYTKARVGFTKADIRAIMSVSHLSDPQVLVVLLPEDEEGTDRPRTK